MSKLHIIRNVNNLIKKSGYQIVRMVPEYANVHDSDNKIRINIGSGDWSHSGWLNLDYPSEWYKSVQSKHTIIPYDIRNDLLPFEDESVDFVYCSHVIEHIENEYINGLFNEIYRVLKPNGGGRFCCPDAEFLYKVTKAGSFEFWKWRNSWFNSELFNTQEKREQIGNPRLIDYLVREIATPKLLNYKYSIGNKDHLSEFNELSMYDFLEYLTSDLVFRTECVGDHINYWTFDKAESMLQNSGFKTIVHSKWGGSMFKEMQDLMSFDVVFPNMSLYFEFLK